MPEIHVLLTFEVAQAIDLEAVQRQAGPGSERPGPSHRGRPSTLFQYRPAPLRFSRPAAPLPLGRWQTEPAVDLVLYDFGAASVTYRIVLDGGLAELREASRELQRTDRLRADARSRVETLLASLGTAVTRPRVADLSEDYTIFGLREVPGGSDAGTWCQAHATAIAGVLRPDDLALSPDEVRDATELRISFGPYDITLVDWDAAFVLDPDPEDVREVLEFANVQLLEMRWLDQELDLAIERSYRLLGRRRRLPMVTAGSAADLREVATLQLESAILLERVTNSLKVFGEEYLARIYRLAARRFRLPDLDAAITRKLGTIESIYQKLHDRAATVRLELLEWVVIILITLEIVLGLA